MVLLKNCEESDGARRSTLENLADQYERLLVQFPLLCNVIHGYVWYEVLH